MKTTEELQFYKESLITAKEGMIKYMKLKTGHEDYHAVQDAASDIREIDAKISIINWMLGLSSP